jgi:geranylgeranyl pyrophosphate synthase
VSDAAQRARFEEYWGRASLSTADVDSIQGLFEAAGTLQAARQAIASETDAALKSLEAVRPGRARDDLRNLALALLNRDH